MATRLHWKGDRAGRFYVAIAIVAILAVGIGFSTTYFLPMARGTFQGPPIAHVHGLLFIAWTATMLTQPMLIRLRRTGLSLNGAGSAIYPRWRRRLSAGFQFASFLGAK